VATNTESGKNVGHAVLYETVLTIMDIMSESGLRVLAINILGRFLSNSDRNIRYVALNTLLKTVHIDHNAVQRHRSTILDCLKENDISIQKRALELSFALINENNIRSIMKDIMSFLEVSDPEFKSQICTNILTVTEKYSPNPRWHIDIILSMLIKAGAYIREDLVSGIIGMVSDHEDLHNYCVQKLYLALTEDISQQPLCQVGVWSVGEYGDLLLKGDLEEEEPVEVTEDEVLDVVVKILQSPHSTQLTRDYAMNTVMKLSTRFTVTLSRIKYILSQYCNNLDVELQQRAVEYVTIFSKYDRMRNGIFEKMPAIGKSEAAGGGGGGGGVLETASLMANEETVVPQAPTVKENEGSTLLDLLGGDVIIPQVPPSSSDTGTALFDLLDMTSSAPPTSTVVGGNDLGGLMDLLSEPLMTTPTSMGTPTMTRNEIPSIIAHEKNNLKIQFDFQKNSLNPTSLRINLTASNSSNNLITDFVFQAAVPKTFQLQMSPPSGNALPPNNGGSVTQTISIENPQKQPLRMRTRISYNANGVPVLEQGEVNNFPPQLNQF
jgi:AP-1 complex subunit gamma-1